MSDGSWLTEERRRQAAEEFEKCMERVAAPNVSLVGDSVYNGETRGGPMQACKPLWGLLLALGAATTSIAALDDPSTAVKDVTGSRPTLEMVFVIDTTGSMSGLIEGAKLRVWAIVNDVLKAKDHPNVRVGLVAYRDRGDRYVTQVLPLTRDLDKVYTTLMDYKAEGGGDTPENVRRALAEGLRSMGWAARSPNVAQILFLVGDAPPHDDYQDEPDTLTTASEAAKSGLIVNAIQCGGIPGTREIWQSIARRGEGQFFAIAQDGGVHGISTPMDKELGELGSKLGATYTAFGSGGGMGGIGGGTAARFARGKEQAANEAKVAAAAPPAAAADRAVNKLLNRDAYVDDLLQSIENGSVKLKDVKPDDLPDDLKALTPEAREKAVEKRLAERKAIRNQIADLAKKRDAFIADARKKLSPAQTGFDEAVSKALREQTARKGIRW
jgi:Mg-chelatase subunit ChlD